MTDEIRIGCQFGPFKGRQQFLDTARRLEADGYSVATVPDHFGGWASVWPSVAAIATVTTTLRIGTLTINNDLWNPVVLARDAVSADQLSDGRLELGMGAGWRIADYEFTGITQDPPGVRISRMSESIDLLRSYFGPGEVVHRGEHYTADVPADRLRPVNATGIPIFVGGGGPKIVRVAAQKADIVGVHINLRGGQFTIGKGASDTDQGVVGDAVEERLAWIDEAVSGRGERPPLQLFFMEIKESNDPAATTAEIAATFGIEPSEVATSPYFLVGSTSEMAEKILSIRERYGITYFTCREDHIPVVSKVIPLLHR